jgi:hypothetical protein
MLRTATPIKAMSPPLAASTPVTPAPAAVNSDRNVIFFKPLGTEQTGEFNHLDTNPTKPRTMIEALIVDHRTDWGECIVGLLHDGGQIVNVGEPISLEHFFSADVAREEYVTIYGPFGNDSPQEWTLHDGESINLRKPLAGIAIVTPADMDTHDLLVQELSEGVKQNQVQQLSPPRRDELIQKLQNHQQQHKLVGTETCFIMCMIATSQAQDGNFYPVVIIEDCAV